MPTRKKTNSLDVITVLAPYVQLAVLCVGIVLWAYNTFAQISYVKEQNASLQGQIEKGQKEQQDFCDRNRQRVETVLGDVKETVKSLELRIIAYQEGKRR
jgi:hypothetical protein